MPEKLPAGHIQIWNTVKDMLQPRQAIWRFPEFRPLTFKKRLLYHMLRRVSVDRQPYSRFRQRKCCTLQKSSENIENLYSPSLRLVTAVFVWKKEQGRFRESTNLYKYKNLKRTNFSENMLILIINKLCQ